MSNPHLLFVNETMTSTKQFWRAHEPINLWPKKVPEYLMDATLGQVIYKGNTKDMEGRMASLDSIERQGVIQIGDLLQCSEKRLKGEFAIATSSIDVISKIIKDWDDTWCNGNGTLFLGMNLGEKQTKRYRNSAATRGWQY